MKTNQDKNKTELTDEEAIQQRIREMVLEESDRESRELEKKINDQANAEALHEITGVSKKKIAAITKQVRTEHYQEKKNSEEHKKDRTSFFRKTPFIIILTVVVPIVYQLIQRIDTKSINKPDAKVVKAKQNEAKEIIKAIDEADMHLLRYLIIEKGYDINNTHRNSAEQDYLYRALSKKNPAIAIFLINKGALVAPDARVRNYVSTMIKYKKYSELKQVMAEAMAKEAGENSAIAKLLAKGYPYFERDFIRAVTERDYEALKLFREAKQGNFNYNWHNQGLITAAFQNNPDMLNFLFDNWSKFKKGSLSGALHVMVAFKNKKVAQRILNEGASVDAPYSKLKYAYGEPEYTHVGRYLTVLENALWGSRIDMAKWLISQGADINIGGCLPLNVPFILGEGSGRFTIEHYDMVKLLIDNGASVNKVVSGQDRPLKKARRIKRGRPNNPWIKKAIELLESNGAIE